MDVYYPVCLDHPHNAVLLICSSYGNGCHPYMCDTIHLLSDYFRQFYRLKSVAPSECCGSKTNEFVGGELSCPLYRGKISRWMVVESARDHMNGLVRDCSVDGCEFSGNYSDLKNHAENEHPRNEAAEIGVDVISDLDLLDFGVGVDDLGEADWDFLDLYVNGEAELDMLEFDLNDLGAAILDVGEADLDVFESELSGEDAFQRRWDTFMDYSRWPLRRNSW